MSLYCDETGYDIEFGAPLYAGTRSDVNFYSALSEAVIRQIPDNQKSDIPCRVGVDGVDIHKAHSSRNLNGAYTITDFTLGAFLFSISKEIAEVFIPVHMKKRYNKSA